MCSPEELQKDIETLRKAINKVREDFKEDHSLLQQVWKRLFVYDGNQKPVLQQLDDLDKTCARIEEDSAFTRATAQDLAKQIHDVIIRPKEMEEKENGYRRLIFGILEKLVLIAIGALTGMNFL